MICYRDMTFCSSDCDNRECRRHFSEEVEKGARKWWSHDPDNAPIAFSDFSKTCPDYLPRRGNNDSA